jgi:hypothetical protein
MELECGRRTPEPDLCSASDNSKSWVVSPLAVFLFFSLDSLLLLSVEAPWYGAGDVAKKDPVDK